MSVLFIIELLHIAHQLISQILGIDLIRLFGQCLAESLLLLIGDVLSVAFDDVVRIDLHQLLGSLPKFLIFYLPLHIFGYQDPA